MDAYLTSEEASRRLGVTVKTLYVYVSRGLIESHREKGTRASFFSRADVERLATRSRRPEQLGPWSIDSSITSISPDGIRYRGMLLGELIDRPFEDVAEHLWQAERGDWSARPLPLPAGLSAMDRICCGVPLAGSADPFRSDRRPEAIITAARRLLGGLARTLAAETPTANADGSVPYFLAAALARDEPSDDLVRTVNSVMVLLADRAISTSMLAVRFATGTRADLYSAVMAGLGVLMGPYFSASSEAAIRLLRYAGEVGVERAVAEELRWRGALPAFSAPFHPDGDPRFAMALPSLLQLLTREDRALINELLLCVERQQLPPANVDLSLALLVYATGADASFGPAIFALSRISGWVAHYLEELAEPMGRFYPGLTYKK